MKVAELQPSVKYIAKGSPLHEKVIKAFRQRLRASQDEKRKKREKAWEESENTYMAYMPETEVDVRRKADRSRGVPEYTTIKVPYSYAMLLTAHTYYSSVFLSRSPIFQMQGRHGESQTAESCVEALLDYQVTTGGNLPPLFIWLMDVGKYGVGILGQYWEKEEFELTRYEERPRQFLGIDIPGTVTRELVTIPQFGYEGNKFYNIRPHDFHTDPNVPILRFQEGEFCIVYDRVSWTRLAQRAADGMYYNLKYLQGSDTRQQDLDGTGMEMNLPGEDLDFYGFTDKHPAAIDQYEFHWTLIPSEVGLRASDRPEKWVFTIGNKDTILSAQPLGLMHNRYPFDILTQEIEGYNVYNRSMLEVLEPLNQTMEWLFNSHFYNVRAALNNMFLADPSRVNLRDAEEPGPGKLIRLKPAGYGADVRSMMTQFSVQDVTRGNLADSEVVGLLAQRVMGVSDNIMGAVNPGGRKTATEVRSSTTFGINRLKTSCEWFSAMGFAPLAQKMVMNTQQLMTIDRQFKVVGDQALWAGGYLPINPMSIAGFFDFVPVDGTMPVDRFAQANLWQNLLTNLARVPGALQAYDLTKIFAFIAQLGGIKNINRFRIQVMPDMALQGQAQSGNVVPMKSNLNEPGQIPQLGATG